MKKSKAKSKAAVLTDSVGMPMVNSTRILRSTAMGSVLNPNAKIFSAPGGGNEEMKRDSKTIESHLLHSPPDNADELGGFEIASDPQVDQNGPLSNTSIELENRRHVYHFDVQSPICRHRHLPVGAVTILNDQDKQWLKFAHDHNLQIEIQRQNPKQPESDSYHRYRTSSTARTLRQYYSALSKAGISTSKTSKDMNCTQAYARILL